MLKRFKNVLLNISSPLDSESEGFVYSFDVLYFTQHVLISCLAKTSALVESDVLLRVMFLTRDSATFSSHVKDFII